MKKVFSNSADVIHLFANQLQPEARCSNVYFDIEHNSNLNYATKIYSYGSHYLLGEFIDSHTIVVNDDGYSSTTSQHISQLLQATSHKTQFLKSESDLDTILTAIRNNAQKLISARKPELYTSPSFDLWSRLNDFINHTGRKAMKRTIQYKEIFALIVALNDNPKNSIYAVIKFNKNRKAKEKRIAAAKLRKETKEFRAHKRDFLSGYGNNDLLRVSLDGATIETSQRVTISTKEAKRLLTLIDNKKILGATIDDKFIVTAFNGALRVGCHNISIEEINLIRTHL